MKSIRWTIWILGAFLVMATLDSLPDPPAVNPGATLSSVLLHHCDCQTATQRFDSPALSLRDPRKAGGRNIRAFTVPRIG